MPAKNRIKPYIENGFYHLYNRGVEKRDIFLDSQDFRIFLHFLKIYLSPPFSDSSMTSLTSLTRTDLVRRVRLRIKSLYQEIELLAYCLLPNHFHLLIKQKTPNAITKLMRQVCTSYVIYFNRRYERIGGLFQDVYKGVLIENEPYLLHLSRYIHLNPLGDTLNRIPPKDLQRKLLKSYSSYPEYLGQRKTSWVHPQEILGFFRTARRIHLKDFLSYQGFVEDYPQPPEETLGNFTLE